MMRQIGKEHNPPHIHARYSGHEATFTLNDGELYMGEFPNRASQMVKEFILKNQSELLNMWETKVITQLKGLD